MINFLNPYPSIYFNPKELSSTLAIPFNREIFWLFLKHLDNRLKMFNHRVNIVLTDKDDIPTNQKFASTYEHTLKIDAVMFQEKDDLEKKKMLLDIIYNAFSSLAKDYNWNNEIITDAYNKALKDNYTFLYSTEYKISRNKKNKANINISLNNRIAIINTLITDVASNACKEIELLKTDEDNISWYRRVKEFGWLNKTRFGLKFMDGELWMVINIENNEREIIITPKKRSKEKIETVLKELLELPG